MDGSTVARWRTLYLIRLGAFLGMSVIVYDARLLPGDVNLHRERPASTPSSTISIASAT
jgi:hypothetical protein